MEEYFVQREVFDKVRLDEVAQRDTSSTGPTVGKKIKEFTRCSVPRLKQIVQRWIPVLDWLPKYSIRENAIGDLVSGCSVAIMHLPQGMAYALLASLRPVYGLYTSLFPVLVYLIFGTSRHISIGTFAVISIMVGSVTERLGPDSDFPLDQSNNTGGVDIDARDAYRVTIACSLTLLVGIFQILLGVVRFGFVVNYLSEPLVRGYTTASACHVFVSQLKYIFGVSPSRYNGPLSLIYTVVDICSLLPQTKIPELVVSLVALVVLIAVKEVNGCYAKKLPLPIPIELIVVIVATIVTHFAELTTLYHIDVVGEIPSGLQAPRAPDLSLFSQVIGDAFAVAIVGYAINISLERHLLYITFCVLQELVALGLSNSIGACFQCYSVTSSLSRSLVQESTGGKTQVAGLISSIFVLIIVLKIGALFEDLPKAVLSTIVFVNLKGMFKQFTDVPQLWRSNKIDLLVWLITFLSTILLNLDLGLAVSIIFSILTVIFRTQLPRYSVLGQVPGTDLYLETETYKQAKEIPGIKIFRSSATVYYTNAEMYLDALEEKSGIEIEKLLMKKKTEQAKLKRQQEKEKKRANKDAKKQATGSFTLTESQSKVPTGLNGHSHGNGAPSLMAETKGKVNWAYQHDAATLDTESDTDTRQTQDGVSADEEQKTHSIILDLSTTSFVDTVTVKTLKNIFRDFGEIDVDVYLAGCQACVIEQFEKANFFTSSIPQTRLFVTVHDAVLYIQRTIYLPREITCVTQM
uniref:Si:ch211-117c9.2 n=1 Tax=Neogobius melanostomus TaxID=47308 RepID=A0A8C6WPS8_9GOBI